MKELLKLNQSKNGRDSIGGNFVFDNEKLFLAGDMKVERFNHENNNHCSKSCFSTYRFKKIRIAEYNPLLDVKKRDLSAALLRSIDSIQLFGKPTKKYFKKGFAPFAFYFIRDVLYLN